MTYCGGMRVDEIAAQMVFNRLVRLPIWYDAEYIPGSSQSLIQFRLNCHITFQVAFVGDHAYWGGSLFPFSDPDFEENLLESMIAKAYGIGSTRLQAIEPFVETSQ